MKYGVDKAGKSTGCAVTSSSYGTITLFRPERLTKLDCVVSSNKQILEISFLFFYSWP